MGKKRPNGRAKKKQKAAEAAKIDAANDAAAAKGSIAHSAVLGPVEKGQQGQRQPVEEELQNQQQQLAQHQQENGVAGTGVARDVEAERAGKGWMTRIIALIFVLMLFDYGAQQATSWYSQYQDLSQGLRVSEKLARGYEDFSQLAHDASVLSKAPDRAHVMDLRIDDFTKNTEIPRTAPALDWLDWTGYNSTKKLRENGREAIANVVDTVSSVYWTRGFWHLFFTRTHPSEVAKTAARNLQQLREQIDHFREHDIAELMKYIDAEGAIVDGYVAEINLAKPLWEAKAEEVVHGPNWWYRKPIIKTLRYVARRINEAVANLEEQTRQYSHHPTVNTTGDSRNANKTQGNLVSNAALRLADHFSRQDPVLTGNNLWLLYSLQSRIAHYNHALSDLKGPVDDWITEGREAAQNLTARIKAFSEEYADLDSIVAAATEPPLEDSPDYTLRAFADRLRPLLRHLCILPKEPEKGCRRGPDERACITAAEVEERYGLAERFLRPEKFYRKLYLDSHSFWWRFCCNPHRTWWYFKSYWESRERLRRMELRSWGLEV